MLLPIRVIDSALTRSSMVSGRLRRRIEIEDQCVEQCTRHSGPIASVIAAVHGVAFGGGLQIALGADIRCVTSDVKLR